MRMRGVVACVGLASCAQAQSPAQAQAQAHAHAHAQARCDLTDVVTPSASPPIPAIVDDGDAGMAHFYARLAELARGKATDHVRVAVYGDSNMTSDFVTGELRRVFQKRFGDGGHGFVDLAGHLFYHHLDVERGDSGDWTAFTLVNNPAPDGMYGFGMMAAESRRQGASTWVATAHDTSPIGGTASRFDLFFLKGPRFGTADVTIDGAPAGTVDAHADKLEAATQRFTIPDGPHKIAIASSSSAAVRLFGLAVERSAPSVIVDSLGVTSADVRSMVAKNDAAVWSRALALRKYDLVVFLTGTNEYFGIDKHRAIMKSLIDLHRAALPGVSILVVAPPDRVDGDRAVHSTWTLVETAKEKRILAAENKCAFWDLREAMGGDASALEFVRTKKMESDKRHFTREGGFWVGDRIAYAMWRGFVGYVKKHSESGCGG